MRKPSRSQWYGALWLIIGWCLCVPSRAQTVNDATWEVFLERGISSDGRDRLTFIGELSGRVETLDVHGERYTVLEDNVLFYDWRNRQVFLAAPETGIIPHPFIQLEAGARRVDWVVSGDSKRIAWTITEGETQALRTRTYIANRDGSEQTLLLADGPRDSIRAWPVALDVGRNHLYMDAQPDGLGRFTPFTQYAGLFLVDIATGEIRTLPGEPTCFCGAGIGAGFFLRLTLTADLNGFDLRVINLDNSSETTIPAMRIRNYTLAGDILIAPDGSQAVYALAQIEGFGTPNQQVETVFMRVDLLTMTQTPLTQPITTFVHPLQWTEDNSAILFTSPQRDGTWKIDMADGRLTRVANATYIGHLQRR